MRKNEFFLFFSLLLAAQCVICNYFYPSINYHTF